MPRTKKIVFNLKLRGFESINKQHFFEGIKKRIR